jgi:hypothetical protein
VKKLLIAAVAVTALSSAGIAQAASTAPALVNANQASSNWSGYVASGAGQSFTDVKGTWVQPTVTCTARTTAYSSFWVGLGGSSSSATGLEQLGTSSDCRNGTPTYSAWWEILPAAATPISFTPAAGDTISGEVSAAGTQVTLSLTDVTSGATFSTTQTVATPDTTSADWIAEAPSECTGRGTSHCTVLALAPFGTASFSAAAATANGHTGVIADTAWLNQAIDLRGSGTGTATTSVLGADGASFTVAAAASATTIPTRPGATRTPFPRGGGGGWWHPRHWR